MYRICPSQMEGQRRVGWDCYAPVSSEKHHAVGKEPEAESEARRSTGWIKGGR